MTWSPWQMIFLSFKYTISYPKWKTTNSTQLNLLTFSKEISKLKSKVFLFQKIRHCWEAWLSHTNWLTQTIKIRHISSFSDNKLLVSSLTHRCLIKAHHYTVILMKSLCMEIHNHFSLILMEICCKLLLILIYLF